MTQQAQTDNNSVSTTTNSQTTSTVESSEKKENQMATNETRITSNNVYYYTSEKDVANIQDRKKKHSCPSYASRICIRQNISPVDLGSCIRIDPANDFKNVSGRVFNTGSYTVFVTGIMGKVDECVDGKEISKRAFVRFAFSNGYQIVIVDRPNLELFLQHHEGIAIVSCNPVILEEIERAFPESNLADTRLIMQTGANETALEKLFWKILCDSLAIGCIYCAFVLWCSCFEKDYLKASNMKFHNERPYKDCPDDVMGDLPLVILDFLERHTIPFKK